MIVLRYYEGCSNCEFAMYLGITEAGVCWTDRYARCRLRGALTEGRHEQP
ncbi:sigma-70 RNA polymerase sigma factor region 4 domain-containing protein [Streptomyces mangrovi]